MQRRPVQLEHREAGESALWDELVEVLAANNETDPGTVRGPPALPGLVFGSVRNHAHEKQFIDALFLLSPMVRPPASACLVADA